MKTKPPEKPSTTPQAKAMKYGLTEEARSALLAAQKNQCAICGLVFKSTGPRGPVTDHDHDVGELRGLLCLRCNLLLGHAEDDPELLKKAAHYLEQFLIAYTLSHPESREFLFQVKTARKPWYEKVKLREAEYRRLMNCIGHPDCRRYDVNFHCPECGSTEHTATDCDMRG
jgi:rubredoxin